MLYKLRGLVFLGVVFSFGALSLAQSENFEFENAGRTVAASDAQAYVPLMLIVAAFIVIVNVAVIVWGIRTNRGERN